MENNKELTLEEKVKFFDEVKELYNQTWNDEDVKENDSFDYNLGYYIRKQYSNLLEDKK